MSIDSVTHRTCDSVYELVAFSLSFEKDFLEKGLISNSLEFFDFGLYCSQHFLCPEMLLASFEKGY